MPATSFARIVSGNPDKAMVHPGFPGRAAIENRFLAHLRRGGCVHEMLGVLFLELAQAAIKIFDEE